MTVAGLDTQVAGTAGEVDRLLRLRSDIGELDRLGRFTEALARHACLSAVRSYHLRLAADELATNVIMHGYGPGRPGVLLVRGRARRGAVRLRLVDGAPRFDPHNEGPEVDIRQPLNARQPGGLGLHLVRSVADDFRWEYRAARNCQSLLILDRPPDAAGSPFPPDSP